MSRKVRLLSAISVVALLLASCGGGDSSGRTKNSALCYETQEAKVAAVELALAAFNAAMGNAPSEEVVDETPTSTIEETPTTVVEETPTTLEETSGGGYRRPAVRTSSDGDTTTTVEASSDGGEVVLTPEQQQAQMDLEAAEAQPLCEADAESASEVTCSATATIDSSVSDDCADGDVRLDWGGSWTLVNTAEDGTETVLAQGIWDVAALSADNPITIPITYGGTSGEGESSTDGCTATLTSTGISWDCPNGELFNVAIEDISNPGLYPLVECSSSGSHTVADGQQFWFNFYLVNGEQTFFEGYNDEREQNVPISFEVPEDTAGVCSEEAEMDFADWDSLPFSGQSDAQLQVETYSFTVPDGFEGSVMVRFESTDEFDVDMSDFDDFESEPCEGSDCTEFVGYTKWDLEPGDYKFNIDQNSEAVMWTANVEISAAPSDFPTLPFTYSTDGSEQTFVLVLEESQLVTLTATSGQTCAVFEDNKRGNGFADPELDLEGPGVDEFDDNSGRGVGNCSAALISEELEPGTYTVTVEDDDGEGFAVVLGSSVELQLLSINWDQETIDVTGSTAIEFNVPAGGAWFRAEVFTNQLETYTYSDPELETQIDSGGCANPDGDNSTSDSNCVLLNLEVLGGSEEYESESDEYTEVTQVDGNWLESWINSYGRSMEVFFPEGAYTLFAWGEVDGQEGEFTLKYGFVSSSLSDAIEIDVKPIDNPEIPTSSSSAGLSTNAMTSDGRISTAIASSVSELVCDTACIDDLFAKAGITEGSIAVSAGNETVTVKKGQRGVLIPIDKNADKISVSATSADGTQVVNLSSQIDQLSATEQSAFESMTSSSPNDSGFNLLYLLLLIPVLGAVFFIIRRKQTVSISK
jgi:hypothetical protein